jgi:hypothetical protein
VRKRQTCKNEPPRQDFLSQKFILTVCKTSKPLTKVNVKSYSERLKKPWKKLRGSGCHAWGDKRRSKSLSIHVEERKDALQKQTSFLDHFLSRDFRVNRCSNMFTKFCPHVGRDIEPNDVGNDQISLIGGGLRCSIPERVTDGPFSCYFEVGKSRISLTGFL